MKFLFPESLHYIKISVTQKKKKKKKGKKNQKTWKET